MKTAKSIQEPRAAADERAFLGEEFLTWLWWRAETGKAEFDITENRRAGVAIEPPLLLRAAREDSGGERQEQLLRFGQPLRSPEAGAALRRGKRLIRAKLTLGADGREWVFTFDAETFALRGVKTPAPQQSEDSGDRVLESATPFSELFEWLDELYRVFLTERLAPEFRRREWRRMREWAQSKT